MKKIHKLIYHSIYWIYRVIHMFAYTYFTYNEKWYKGAYVVQLVLMPFFYFNYAILIPSLIDKKYKKFTLLTILWLAAFIVVYAQWTIYQRHFLYGEKPGLPNYIETLNNLIYIWLISSSFCLLEHWIQNLNNNKKLAVEKKKHLLNSEENKMLNHLLSDYLHTMTKIKTDVLPDKILLVSDFFKYILYEREKLVKVKEEITYIRMYEELKNASKDNVKISFNKNVENYQIPSALLITNINKLVELNQSSNPIEVTIDLDSEGNLLLYTPLANTLFSKEKIQDEFPLSRIEVNGSHWILPIPT